jgi:hypothetical protein
VELAEECAGLVWVEGPDRVMSSGSEAVEDRRLLPLIAEGHLRAELLEVVAEISERQGRNLPASMVNRQCTSVLAGKSTFGKVGC